MKSKNAFILYISFIFCFAFVLSSCVSSTVTPELPKDATVKYNDNGTPTYIKSINIAASLEEDQVYQKMKEGKHYQEMVYILMSQMQDVFKLSDPKNQLELKHTTQDKLNLTRMRFRPVPERNSLMTSAIAARLGPVDAQLRL